VKLCVNKRVEEGGTPNFIGTQLSRIFDKNNKRTKCYLLNNVKLELVNIPAFVLESKIC